MLSEVIEMVIEEEKLPLLLENVGGLGCGSVAFELAEKYRDVIFVPFLNRWSPLKLIWR